MKKLSILILLAGLMPIVISANGGDQRLVERGKYYINLSRAPFTPRVGVKTSFVAAFFDVGADRLIKEDLTVRVRISKLGDAPKGKFVFEQDNITVKGGVLEFPYTFSEAGLHEIFFDFAFASNPQKTYEAPDFLIDVQRQKTSERNQFLLPTITSIVGLFIGFIIGRTNTISN
ncbi:MAG: hypothetical protein Q8Q92_03160 [bacterium]|nr:hypothetical protein [bacterium]